MIKYFSFNNRNSLIHYLLLVKITAEGVIKEIPEQVFKCFL